MHFVHRFLLLVKRFDLLLCSGMVQSSFAVPNSKVSGFGDLEPFAAMSVSMPATLAAFAGAATSLAPSSRLSVSLALKGGRVASLLEALCGLVDPGAQAAAAATVAVFSVDAFEGMLIMLPEGCVPGAVAGSARPSLRGLWWMLVLQQQQQSTRLSVCSSR